MPVSLSDRLLQDMCAERSDSMLMELGAGAAIRVPQSTDVIAHFVLDGTIDIDVNKMEQPVTLRRGEYGLMLYGSGHRISTGPRVRTTRDHLINTWPAGDEPPTLKVGDGKPGARFISAALRLMHNSATASMVHPLPELLPLKSDAKPLFMNTALLTDTLQINAACHGPGAGAFINTLMNLHLTHAIRCIYDQFNRNFPFQVGVPLMRPITAAIRMLRTHPEKNWTVAGLAHELGQSRSSFAAKFHAHVGTGPMEYLHNIRMEKAAELLETEVDMPLLTIARRVGYGAASSFSRAFKSHFGVPPRVFCEQGAARPGTGKFSGE